jgi:hypothetical protein
MSETITCPLGLSGRIRGMKAREERTFQTAAEALDHAARHSSWFQASR